MGIAETAPGELLLVYDYLEQDADRNNVDAYHVGGITVRVVKDGC